MIRVTSTPAKNAAFVLRIVAGHLEHVQIRYPRCRLPQLETAAMPLGTDHEIRIHQTAHDLVEIVNGNLRFSGEISGVYGKLVPLHGQCCHGAQRIFSSMGQGEV